MEPGGRSETLGDEPGERFHVVCHWSTIVSDILQETAKTVTYDIPDLILRKPNAYLNAQRCEEGHAHGLSEMWGVQQPGLRHLYESI